MKSLQKVGISTERSSVMPPPWGTITMMENQVETETEAKDVKGNMQKLGGGGNCNLLICTYNPIINLPGLQI